MMSVPLVTVVTVVLNDSANIGSTIKSVISQTYPGIEYIVVDGESKDGTIDAILNYKDQISHFLSEPDRGIYDAMNKGTNLASGEWILYLNSGDQLSDSNLFEKIFNCNNQSLPTMDVIYSDVIADNKITKKLRKAKGTNRFWRGMPFSHQACLVKTSMAKKRLFSLEFTICSDLDFYYGLYHNNAKFYYSEYPIAIVDITTGISKNGNLKILYSEYFKICRKYSSGIQMAGIYLISILEYLYAIIRRILLRVI